jgi:ABC-type multidrug transport system fused ATPase/permease subunit
VPIQLTAICSSSTLEMEVSGGGNLMELNIVTLIISMLLFFVLFFGIGFLLNMLLRMTWVMAVIYPIIAIFIIDKVRFIEYFRNSKESFVELGNLLMSLAPADMLILSSGLAGAIAAGFTMKVLRKKGYAMF